MTTNRQAGDSGHDRSRTNESSFFMRLEFVILLMLSVASIGIGLGSMVFG